MKKASRLLIGTAAAALLSSAAWPGQASGQLAAAGPALAAAAGLPFLLAINAPATPDAQAQVQPASVPVLPRPPAYASWTQGRKTLVFIRAHFADDPRDYITAAKAYSLVQTGNQFLVENSYNSLWVIGTVTPYVTLPMIKAWYERNDYTNVVFHAQLAAKAAGFDSLDYDWSIVHTASLQGQPADGIVNTNTLRAILMFAGAQDFFVPRSLMRLLTWVPADRWETGSPSGAGQPPDPDSDIGHPALNAPGRNVPQGDPYDLMGSSRLMVAANFPNQINPLEKSFLRWLGAEYIRKPMTNGTARLYAFDTPTLVPGRYYSLVVPKDGQHDYWLDYRQLWSGNLWLANGIEVRWGGLPQIIPDPMNSSYLQNSYSNGIVSQLLDTTPGSANAFNDAALVVGRTLADPQAGVYITPVARGGQYPDQWIDVVVQKGNFANNRPPVVAVAASALFVTNGAAVTFYATASDPDGDKLAYYWEFSDHSFGSNAPTITRSFAQDGQYVVRCEVSDMKGGFGSQLLLITVGATTNHCLNGTVIDSNGNPLAGVRVHNGIRGNGYSYCFTDSQGNFIIPNLAPGDYSCGAFIFGYTIEPMDFINPVTIAGGDVYLLDFIATPVPRVSIAAAGDATEGSTTGAFVISRTGDTNAALPVFFTTYGNAIAMPPPPPPDTNDPPAQPPPAVYDYSLKAPDGTVLVTNMVTIPAGAYTLILTVVATNDSTVEGMETATLSLVLADYSYIAESVTTDTNNVSTTNYTPVPYPGWEMRTENQVEVSHQTDPLYVIGPLGEASIFIRDSGPSSTTVSVLVPFVSDEAVAENGHDSAAVWFKRVGNLLSDMVVNYTVGGTASNGIDYAWLPGSFTMPAGAALYPLYIDPIDDLFVEGNETITITANPSPGGYYTVDNSAASTTVTIIDDDLPLVTVYATDEQAAEAGLDPGTFVFTRGGDVSRSLEVLYLVEGTATPGADYVALPGLVTIPAGQLSATVTVTPIDDTLTEGNETVTVFVSVSPAYNIGSPNLATVTIQDDEMPTINVDVPAAGAEEAANAPGTFRLTRTGNTNDLLVVTIQLGGTALNQFDYAAVGTNVLFPAGSAEATVTITPVDDKFRELAETVLLQVLPGPNYNLGANTQGVVTIADNDDQELPEVSFLQRVSTSPESVRTNLLYVQISADPASDRSPVYISYGVVGGSATSNVDYTMPGPTYLTFSNGGPQFLTIPLLVTNDALVEPTETVIVGLFDPIVPLTNSVVTNITTIDTNSTPPVTNTVTQTNLVVTLAPTNGYIGAYRTHTLSIVDEKLYGGNVVSIAATKPQASEDGPTPGAFTLSRTGGTNLDLTVFFAVAGSAASRNDYAPLGNSIVIPAGSAAVELPVLPVDDPEEELMETVIVTLTGAPGAQIHPTNNTAVVFIADNDGTIQFLKSEFAVIESDTNVVVTVVRTGAATNRAAWVDYLVTDGTATRGSDYFATNGTLYFAPGERYQTFTVTVTNDTLVEPDETVLLSLANPTGGVPLGGQNTATLKILNDDTAYSFVTLTNKVNENAGTAKITVQRYGVLGLQSSVQFSTADGTATTDLDYKAITNQNVIFGVGETNKTVTITIKDDVLFEGDETLSLMLTNPSPNTYLETNSTATLIIVDDECTVAFAATNYVANEFDPFVLLNVVRTGGTVNPISVDYATTNGTAIAPTNYDAQKGTLIFAGDAYALSPTGTGLIEFRPGETNKTIKIILHDNKIATGDKSFGVMLSKVRVVTNTAPAGAVLLGAATNAVVTLLDNEQPGWIDYEFYTGAGADGRVLAITLQYDQSIVFGGEFTTVDGVSFNHIARLRPDGILDTSFNPGVGADSNVLAVASLPDGKVLLGGAFNNVGGAPRSGFARLNANGSIDTGFNPQGPINGVVRAIVVQSTGQIIIGGSFTRIGSADRRFLARYNPNGTLDTTFAPVLDNTVYALSLQGDDRVIVGGAFRIVGANARRSIARLNADGSLDATFSPGAGADGTVLALALQNDGQVLLGGMFSTVDGVSRGHIARLSATGAVDPTFDPGTGADGNIYSVGISPNGKILVGGEFVSISGSPRDHIARLKRNGQVDALYNPALGANGTVRALAAQPNGAIVLGGDFTTVSGVPRNHIARVHGDELLNLTTLEFSAPFFRAAENSGQATITVVRTSKPSLACTVQFVATNGTALDGVNFVATNGTLSFAAGETNKSFTVTLLDDALPNRDTTVSLLLTNGSAVVDLSGMSAATLIIQDDERLVRLGNANYRVWETNASVLIEVLRDGGQSGTVTVDYYTTDGTAVAQRDYRPISGTLTFADQELVKVLQVPIIDDTILKGTRTFTLTIINPWNAGLGEPATATITILDNEAVYGAQSFTNRNAITILDAGSAKPYPSVISVNSLTGVISRVAVTLDGFTHTFPADVDVLLVGPQGRSVMLMSDAGAGYDMFGATLRFDDAATTFLPQNGQIVSSTNRPTDYEPGDLFFAPAPAGPYGNALALFNGSPPNGPWSLYLMDDRGGDSGVVSNGWRLTITSVDPATVNDLAAGLEAAPSSLPAGEVLMYTAYVTNNGLWTATAVRLTDALPAGFNRVTAAPSQGSCAVNDGIVTCALGSVPVGGVASVQIQGVPVFSGSITNSVVVAGAEPDLLVSNNLASVVTTVTAGMTADLGVSITDNPDPVMIGQNLTYTVVVRNFGPMDATGVNLTNRLPAGVTLISTIATQGSFVVNGPNIELEVGDLAVGASATLTLVVKPQAAGQITNSAAAGANEPAINPVNTATAITTVTPAADLTVTIKDTTDPVAINARIVYLINVMNQGPSAAHSVTLFYTLPAALAVQAVSLSQGSNFLSGATLVCDLGTLPSGDSATITVQGQSSMAGILTNYVTVMAAESDPKTANNSDLETTTIYLSNLAGPGIIDNGIVQLGVNPSGDLNAPGGEPSMQVGTPFVGLRYLPTKADGTAPGCLCEGWGVADNITKVTGWADEAMGPTFGLTIESFKADSQTATSVTRVDGPMNVPVFRVTHFYHPSTASRNMYQVDVTIENISSNTVEVLYRRVMDWDVEPTAFNEFVTMVKGDSTNLIFTSNDGFAIPDPLSGHPDLGATGSFVDFGPKDQGALFDFNFGLLQPGQSKFFRTYYGAAGNEDDALKAVAKVGAEAYSLGQPNTQYGPSRGTPNTFIFAFGGIGGTPLAGADLSLTQTAVPNPVGLGDALTYTLWVSNRGPENATSVVLTNYLPANISVSSVTPSKGTWSRAGDQITASFGGLLIGERVRLTVVVVPNQEAILTNSAVVSLAETDGNLDNNLSTNVTIVVARGTFGNPTPIIIADAAPALPYPSVVNVSGLTGVITKVTVTLMDITHGFPSDIDALLVGPQGQNTVLMSDAGQNFRLSGVTLTFDDGASVSLPGYAPITTGAYKPTDLNIGGPDAFAAPAPKGPYGLGLSVFTGTDPNGEWRLYVMDDQGGDDGLMATGWRMTFTTGALQPPQLEFSRSGNQLTISWPDTAAGFVLESAPSLQPADWQAVTPPPTPANGRYTLTVDLTSGSQFYRLRKP